MEVRPVLTGQPIWIPDSTQPAGKALNPAAFMLSANGASNNALRNSIRSPYNISQADLALRRRFNLSERVKLDVRAEYFNIFNHPMFGGVNAPWTSWGNCTGNTPASCVAGSNFGKALFRTDVERRLRPRIWFSKPALRRWRPALGTVHAEADVLARFIHQACGHEELVGKYGTNCLKQIEA